MADWWDVEPGQGAAAGPASTPPPAPTTDQGDWWNVAPAAGTPAAGAPGPGVTAAPPSDDTTRGSFLGPTFDRLTAAAARGATFGLSDVAGAAGAAAGAGLRQVEQSLGGRTAPETVGEAYRRSLAQSRGEAQQFSAEHPWLSAGATGLGSLAGAVPAAVTGKAAGTAAEAAGTAITEYVPEQFPRWRPSGAVPRLPAQPARAFEAVPAAGPATLGGQMATGAAVGAGAGAAGGFAQSQQQPGGAGLGDVLKDTALGAAGGGAIGGALPVAGSLGSRLVSPLARAISDNAVTNQAIQTIARRMGYDVAAGGAGAADIESQLARVPGPSGQPGVGPMAPRPTDQPSWMPPTPQGGGQLAYGTRPVTIADVAGPSARGLAGVVARAPGAKSQVESFLDQRDAGAPGRLLDDIQDLVSTGNAIGPNPPTSTLVDQIKAERQATSNQLYNQAIFDPSGNPLQVTSPELDQVIKGSSTLRGAMDRLRASDPNIPNNAPYTDMRLLDQAYKDASGVASSSLDPQAKRDAMQILGPFRDALTDANPAYGDAIANHARLSTSLDAIENGQGVLAPGRTGADTQQMLSQLSPDDQRLFRLGAADAIAKQVRQVGIGGGNEALQLIGKLRPEQIRPIFGDDQAGFDALMSRAGLENRMFQSKLAATGGAQTAGRVAEAAGPEGAAGGALAPIVTGLGAATAGEPVLAGTQLATGLSRLARPVEITAPSVQSEVARRLWSADPGVQRDTLARVLSMRPPVAPRAAAPISGLAAQMVGPGAASTLNWAASALPFLGPPRGP